MTTHTVLSNLPVHSVLSAIAAKIAEIRRRDRRRNPTRPENAIVEVFWAGYDEEKARYHERLPWNERLPRRNTLVTRWKAKSLLDSQLFLRTSDGAMRELGRLAAMYVATVPKNVVVHAEDGVAALNGKKVETDEELIRYLELSFESVSQLVFEGFR